MAAFRSRSNAAIASKSAAQSSLILPLEGADFSKISPLSAPNPKPVASKKNAKTEVLSAATSRPIKSVKNADLPDAKAKISAQNAVIEISAAKKVIEKSTATKTSGAKAATAKAATAKAATANSAGTKPRAAKTTANKIVAAKVLVGKEKVGFARKEIVASKVEAKIEARLETVAPKSRRPRVPADFAQSYGENRKEKAAPAPTATERKARKTSEQRARLRQIMTPDDELVARLSRASVSSVIPRRTAARRKQDWDSRCGKCGVAATFSTPAALCAKCGAIVVRVLD